MMRIVAAAGAVLAATTVLAPARVAAARPVSAMTRAQATRLDLAGFPALGRLLRWPPLLFLVRLPLVALFAGSVLAGLLGEQSPGRNLATITVWTVWWAALPFLPLPL